MRLRQLFLLFSVAAALCMSSPAFGETILFSDDFQSAATGSPMSSTPSVGSWTIGGDSASTLVTAFGAAPTNNFGGVIRSATWNSIDAIFTEQTSPTDLVRLEADVYGGGGTAHISMYSSTGDYLAYVLLYSNGDVLSPQGLTGQTWDQNEWNHLAIEYSPGATTFDLYIDAQPKATSSVYNTVGGNINQIKFANVTTNWTFVDNVLVTKAPVPEPSTLALLGCGLFGLLVRGRRRR